MKRLFYNCEKIRLSYNNDVDVVYDDSKYPDDDNGYLIIRNVERDPGSLLHIYMYDGLGSDASEIEITDMYDRESKILSIPKVTGDIKIYHAMHS